MTKPIIAINCDIKHNDEVCADYLSEYIAYPDAIELAGGIPLLVPPVGDDADLRQILDGVDGLVLVGGDDFEPSVFGQEKHEKATLMFPRRQAFDFRLTKMAVGMKLPVLGVCCGGQILNLALGGTLHQHVPDVYGMQIVHARGKELALRGEQRLHKVEVEPDTLLAGIVGAGELDVNTIHHQAVDRLADGLRVSSRAVDGLVETIEYADQRNNGFLLGVQWHPEQLCAKRPKHLALFEALVAAAIEYREGRRV